MECEGIGPDRAESIAEWFADDENRRLVEELRALGLRFEAGEEDRPRDWLTGQTYVITGTLEGLSREQAQAEQGARREGDEFRLEEDDGPHSRRGAGRLRAGRGSADGRPAGHGNRAWTATGRLEPRRTDPGPAGPGNGR